MGTSYPSVYSSNRSIIYNDSFLTNEINSELYISPQPVRNSHLRPGPRVCIVGTIALLVAGEVAYRNNNDNLAIGFASAALVTSSVGLVWYIKDQKRK